RLATPTALQLNRYLVEEKLAWGLQWFTSRRPNT
ncbi:rCG23624, partial [Rattus norvegicus]